MAQKTSSFATLAAVVSLALLILLVFRGGESPIAPAADVDSRIVARTETEKKAGAADFAAIGKRFQNSVQPLLKKYCVRCHNAEKMTSGTRVDHLNGKLPDKHLFLWKDILKQVAGDEMPPEDERQPSVEERKLLAEWIRTSMAAARSRDAEKNGSIRRLTVAQYRNTLRDLMGFEDDLTDVLSPDGVSKDGFLNNGRTMLLSPLLVESYFDIADSSKTDLTTTFLRESGSVISGNGDV